MYFLYFDFKDNARRRRRGPSGRWFDKSHLEQRVPLLKFYLITAPVWLFFFLRAKKERKKPIVKKRPNSFLRCYYFRAKKDGRVKNRKKERERVGWGQKKPWDVDARLPASDAKDRVLRRATTKLGHQPCCCIFLRFYDVPNMPLPPPARKQIFFPLLSFFLLLSGSGSGRNRFECVSR